MCSIYSPLASRHLFRLSAPKFKTMGLIKNVLQSIEKVCKHKENNLFVIPFHFNILIHCFKFTGTFICEDSQLEVEENITSILLKNKFILYMMVLNYLPLLCSMTSPPSLFSGSSRPHWVRVRGKQSVTPRRQAHQEPAHPPHTLPGRQESWGFLLIRSSGLQRYRSTELDWRNNVSVHMGIMLL